MASSDYYSCDVCSTKTFYDANVDWAVAIEAKRIGRIMCICPDCHKKYELKLVNKITGKTVSVNNYMDRLITEIERVDE